MEIKPRFSLETIKANLPAGLDPLLPPAFVAELVGVDTKWLAGAREGRKTIQGPPYIKLGEGRTAPIRYRLSSLITWMASFQEQTSTMERPVVPHTTFGRFMSNASPSDRWLFVLAADGRSAMDIFAVIKNETLKSDMHLQWLTHADYNKQRFVKVQVQLDAETVVKLLALGNGEPAAGIEILTSNLT